MALPVESSESKRKPNFTDGEKLFLVHQYELYKPILSSRLCDGVTNRQKQEIWQQITNELNRRNLHVDRTTKDVKKKWENLATQARKEMIDYRQSDGATAPPSTITLKVLELLDDASTPPATRSGGISKMEFDDEDSTNDDHTHLVEQQQQTFMSTTNGAQNHEEDDDDVDGEGGHHRVPNKNRLIIESIEGTDEPSARVSVDNEPSLQELMGLWRQREQLSIIDTVAADCGTSESADDAPSPTVNGPTAISTQGSSDRRRRRRDDDFEDSDNSNPADTSHHRNDIKRLKRLKLQLETEKLMLEKKKLELEILVLNKQLNRDA